MRIDSVILSWFRGAAEGVALETGCKSMVVYGANGSGKSSFVDAVEYLLNQGRIGHLTHEYSGKRQEKAVSSTHRPAGRATEIRVRFQDGSELRAEIAQDGTAKSCGAEKIGIANWDYRRTILRQDEVSAFIHSTKGEKYSALLPLLGLERLETAAENLRQLGKAIEQESGSREIRAVLRQVEAKRRTVLGSESDEQLVERIRSLYAGYCGGTLAAEEVLRGCGKLGAELESRISRFSVDEKRYLALREASGLDIRALIRSVHVASAELAGTVEPLLEEKLEVLQSASSLAEKLEGGGRLKCPACGTLVAVQDFQAHVKGEQHRLQQALAVFQSLKAAISALCDGVTLLRGSLRKADVRMWRDELAKGALNESLTYLDTLDIDRLRTRCREGDLEALEQTLVPLVEAARADSKEVPADVADLAADAKVVEAAKAVFAAKEKGASAARADALVEFTRALEHGVRDEIRLRSQTVINEISADIQGIWEILHPGEAIEDVRLYVPPDAEKAIDIGLKFFGVQQDSPRLTLSEGYRNSLGLSIFLAMAMREADLDRPVFLDDVVVSMDRQHRGMIVEVLEKLFTRRQVIIFTHDRDWYAELRQFLGNKSWTFRALLPYETPDVGIRWSHRTTTFDDARAQLKDRPDGAGNDARKIMDAELAPIAEHLRVRVHYLRGDKNDRRTSHELLELLVTEGTRCFQKRTGTDYAPHNDAIAALTRVDGLLVAWANRASHRFDVVRPEAAKLIDACEEAVSFFKCPSCGKNLWYAHAENSELVQCACGEIRWRYGKA